MTSLSDVLPPAALLVFAFNAAFASLAVCTTAVVLSRVLSRSLAVRHALLVVAIAACLVVPPVMPLLHVPAVWTIQIAETVEESSPPAASKPADAKPPAAGREETLRSSTTPILRVEPNAADGTDSEQPVIAPPVVAPSAAESRSESTPGAVSDALVSAQASEEAHHSIAVARLPKWGRILGSLLCGVWCLGIAAGLVKGRFSIVVETRSDGQDSINGRSLPHSAAAARPVCDTNPGNRREVAKSQQKPRNSSVLASITNGGRDRICGMLGSRSTFQFRPSILGMRKDGTSMAAYTVSTRGSNLNVRSGPGTNYAKVGSVANGARVNVARAQGTWMQLASGGWVHGSYLRRASGGGASSLRDVTIVLSSVQNGSYLARSYPNDDYNGNGKMEAYRVPIYKLFLHGIDNKGNPQTKEWKVLRFMPYWNDPRQPDSRYRLRGWANAGLRRLAKKLVTQYKPNYGVHNTYSPYGGAIVMRDTFYIHAGPTNVNESYWGSAGCAEVVGNFDKFKEDIKHLSGSREPQANGAILEAVRNKRLWVQVDPASAPNLRANVVGEVTR